MFGGREELKGTGSSSNYNYTNKHKTVKFETDEPIIIFTEQRKLGRNSRVSNRPSPKSTKQLSYEDLRARLHQNDRKQTNQTRI